MSYGVRQFLVTDPDGNQMRIGQPTSDDFSHRPAPEDMVGRALHTARLFMNSKEDSEGAAKVLDHLLADEGASLTLQQRVEVLVLRTDVAVQLDDLPRAREAAAEAGRIGLGAEEWAALRDELRRLEDLRAVLDG